MHNAIRKIISKYGSSIITTPRLVSIMDDEGTFSSVENRVYKKLLREVIVNGYTMRFLKIGKWNNESKTLAIEYSKRNALSKEHILYLFNCLAFGLGWTNTSPTIPSTTDLYIDKNHETEIQRKSEEEKVLRLLKESQKRAYDSEIKAKEAEKKLTEVQQKLIEAERRARNVNETRINTPSNTTGAQTYKNTNNRKDKETILSKTGEAIIDACMTITDFLEEYLVNVLVISGLLIWFVSAVYIVFFESDGFWQTTISVFTAVCSFFLTYCCFWLTQRIDEDIESIVIKFIGIVIYYTLVIGIAMGSIEFIDWCD